MITLYEHQAAYRGRAQIQPRLLGYADCGTGKTIAQLAVCDERPMPTIVLAPPLVMENAWLADAAHFPRLRLHVYHGTKRQRQSRVLPAAQADGDRAVLLTTHETFRNDAAMLLASFKPRRLVIDESSKIKNADAKVTRAAIPFADSCDEVQLLSGTPAPNDESEYWAQLRCLDSRTGGWADAPDATTGRPMFMRWALYYLLPIKQLVPGRAKPVVTGWRLRPERQAEFERLLAQAAIRIRKQDCLDLPELVEQPFYVTLGKDERRIYDQLLEEGRAALREGGRERAVRNVAMKLRQVTCGLISDGGNWMGIGDSKLRALDELIDSLGNEPVVVLTSFREEARRALERIEAHHGRKVGLLDGTVGGAAKRGSVADFCAGRIRTLVGNPASMGHGITLTRCGDEACRTTVRLSLGWSYELHQQSRDRIHRAGQRERCTEYQVLARQTIDLRMRQNLAGKRDRTDAEMRGVLAELGVDDPNQSKEVA